MALCSMSHSIVCTMKLVVMLLTFQHLLLLGVLTLSRPSETTAQAYNTSGPCGGILTLDTRERKNWILRLYLSYRGPKAHSLMYFRSMLTEIAHREFKNIRTRFLDFDLQSSTCSLHTRRLFKFCFTQMEFSQRFWKVECFVCMCTSERTIQPLRCMERHTKHPQSTTSMDTKYPIQQ
jgi:hypothetical protein